MQAIKRNEKFISKASGKRIRVLNVIERNSGYANRRDVIEVADMSKNFRTVKGSNRVIFSDSVRRRYFV